MCVCVYLLPCTLYIEQAVSETAQIMYFPIQYLRGLET